MEEQPIVPVAPEKSPRNRKKPTKPKPEGKQAGPSSTPQISAKQRGNPTRDSPEVRVSKTLSWILRHGAKSEGLAMRPDGCVKVTDLLANPKLSTLNLEALQEIVKADTKQRYDLKFDDDIWWIKANQGHSIKSVKLELAPISAASDIPSGVAVHGTTNEAWKLICKQGLSKMKRNHIHLAQGVAGDNNVLSDTGMRKASPVLIFIDVQRAIDAGLKFFLSDNGVVLSEGNERETSKGVLITGWEGSPLTEKLNDLKLS
ncbi:KptA family-domain-containing protein [Mycena metata]|uniref:2'-phosphotransferase n=1 Tax=Mycena metata TaxID=1033252 RepID=A0AAD7H7E2_9AGAR|nr:KptA family-domain-containing protein [Mycena metata]